MSRPKCAPCFWQDKRAIIKITIKSAVPDCLCQYSCLLCNRSVKWPAYLIMQGRHQSECIQLRSQSKLAHNAIACRSAHSVACLQSDYILPAPAIPQVLFVRIILCISRPHSEGPSSDPLAIALLIMHAWHASHVTDHVHRERLGTLP